MKNKEKTVVVFRVWTHYKSVIALFPGIDEGNGHCLSYESVGQHGAASYAGIMAKSRPATPKEYRELSRELRRIGYNLDIRKRWTRR